MCAVQVACLCAERPTDAQFAVVLCEEQITCAHSVGALGVCGVGFTCARVLDMPRLLMFPETVAVTSQYLIFCLEPRNPDIVLTFFVLWLENIDGCLSGEQSGALGKLVRVSSLNQWLLSKWLN